MVDRSEGSQAGDRISPQDVEARVRDALEQAARLCEDVPPRPRILEVLGPSRRDAYDCGVHDRAMSDAAAIRALADVLFSPRETTSHNDPSPDPGVS